MKTLLSAREVRKRVRAIAKQQDDEKMHGDEDDLYQAVLEAIAESRCEDPKACAREALKTRQINFCRWCA